MAQGADMLSRFGHFVPLGEGGKLPPPRTQERYSDAQLYALALYIYSLKPPPNPNTFDSRAAAGEKVFKRERCVICHPPPLFTNNKLTPALKILGQVLNHAAPPGPSRPALADQSPDVPVQIDQFPIHCAERRVLGCPNSVFDLA